MKEKIYRAMCQDKETGLCIVVYCRESSARQFDDDIFGNGYDRLSRIVIVKDDTPEAEACGK